MQRSVGFLLLIAACATAFPTTAYDVIPESEALVQDAPQPQDPIVFAILQVKAWSIIAAAKAKASPELHKNAIFEVIKKMAVTPKNGNIVTQFGEAIGTMEADSSRGMAGYILNGINAAVLKGESVFTHGEEGKMVLDPAPLGFVDAPDYFDQFAVSGMEFQTVLHSLHEDGSAKTVEAWVNKGKAAAYIKNLDLLNAGVKAQEDKVMAGSVAAATEAIKASFSGVASHSHLSHKSSEADKIHAMNPLSGAGTKAGKTVNDASTLVIPSAEELNNAAKVKAEADVKQASLKASMATIVKEVEEAAKEDAIKALSAK